MKEYPIIFKPAMIPKIIDKSKTQTRRIVKLKNPDGYETVTDDGIVLVPHTANTIERDIRCPYGKPGDLLYVKETHKLWFPINPDGSPVDGFWHVRYRVDGVERVTGCGWDEGPDYSDPVDCGLNKEPDKWRSPLFLPKWAARIWLENKGRKAVRLQDINEDEAKAEGASMAPWSIPYGAKSEGEQIYVDGREAMIETDHRPIYRNGFRTLWDKINGKRGHSWNHNDFVWAITFELKSTNGRPA